MDDPPSTTEVYDAPPYDDDYGAPDLDPTDRGPVDRAPVDRGPTDRAPTDRGPARGGASSGASGGPRRGRGRENRGRRPGGDGDSLEIGAASSLPHSEESERAVLAGVLLDPRRLPLLVGRLRPEDFYVERHQRIFEAMVHLQAVESVVDLRTLQARLEQQKQFDMIGGIAYLAGLDLELPDIGRLDTYAEIVKERAVRRQLILACAEITRNSFDGGLEAAEALAEAEKKVFALGEEAVQKGFSVFAQVSKATVESLEERAQNEGSVGVATGFYDWDDMTQGLVAGNLIIIAGRPGMGKTSFAVNVAQHVAIRESKSVGVFSLEMGEQELAMRILASEADLPFGQLRQAQLSENQWNALYGTVREIKAAQIFIDDSPNPNLLEIASKSRRLRAEHGLDLLIVDYLQLMHAGGR
ncbi:MAG: DnaB-like helicase C-terminal domain-containing protein, partial [Acidobacteriota bacterium]